MSEPVTEQIIVGAARVCMNELSAKYPQTASDIIDSSYQTINNWQDIGATKTGVRVVDYDTIECALAEMTLERLLELIPYGPFQIAFLYQTPTDNDDSEAMMSGVGLWHFPSVQIAETVKPDPRRGEASSWLLRLVKFP